MEKSFQIEGQQILLHAQRTVCTTEVELLRSDSFKKVVALYFDHLERHDSPLAEPFLKHGFEKKRIPEVVRLLQTLSETPLEQATKALPQFLYLLAPNERPRLHAFVEGLYNFWRSYDRYLILHAEPGPSSLDRRPYRSFNATVEELTHVVRAAYRDICENITGDHPRIYRQVSAGCDVGLIAITKESGLPFDYKPILQKIPFIRHVWITPPMIINPPMNKRTGEFQKIEQNPLKEVSLKPEEWLCFPAQVGPLVIFVYFHQKFTGLGCALANLFELATDEETSKKPDAIYLFGIPPEHLSEFGPLPTVFYDDAANNLLVGAIPSEDRFGYFGYLKKMILTLHNIVMMKRGRIPFHGAMVRILLKNDREATVLIIGDTGTGKSESLEAFRVLGNEQIRELVIIADDMGSLEIKEGKILGYGTEIGAFVRLDDLSHGYAFEHLDRAIFMSPQKTNARVVVPVTTMEEVLHGYPIDFILYANNYENVDSDHPILERFDSGESALEVFRQGAAMSKGTTTASGLVHNYFANIFGPPQYRSEHDTLAKTLFETAIKNNIYMGEIRTRLGIPGFEIEGPREAAKALLAQLAGGAAA